MRQPYQNAMYLFELFFVHLFITLIFSYGVSVAFVSNEVPVDIWRIFRGLYILGFTLLFFVASFSRDSNLTSFSLVSHKHSWVALMLNGLLAIITLSLAYTFLSIASSLYGSKDFVAIDLGLKNQLKWTAISFMTFVFLYAVRHTERIHSLFLAFPMVTRTIIASAVIIIAALPMLTPGKLNSETHFDLELVERALEPYRSNVGEDVIIELSKSQYTTYQANVRLAESITFLQLHSPSFEAIKNPDLVPLTAMRDYNSATPNDEDVQKTAYGLWKTRTGRPQELCFFSVNVKTQGLKKFEDCVQGKNIRYIPPSLQAYEDFSQNFTLHKKKNDVQHNVYTAAKEPTLAKLYLAASKQFFSIAKENPQSFGDIRRFIGNASSTGFFTHHYAAITHTINVSESIFELASNQYGFGPLLFSKIVKSVWSFWSDNATSYDAIFVATTLSNLILAFVVIAFFRKAPVPSQVLISIGLILSVLVSFSLNHMFSPMVYSIRYLPSLILFAYLAKRAMSEFKSDNHVSSQNQILIHACFALSLAFYNFEYGLLTASGMILAAILHKNHKVSIAYLCSITLAVWFKMFVGGYAAETSGINYEGYFSNFWMSGYFDGILKFLAVGAAIPFAIYLFNRTPKIASFEKDALVILFFMLAFKACFVGSANHAGPVFLLISFLAVVLLLESNSKGAFTLNDAAAYLTVGICLMPIGIIALQGRHGLQNELSFENYQWTKVSKIQPMSSGLSQKMIAAQNIIVDGDLIISPSDSPIALWTEIQVTRPFFDLSTNILEPPSWNKIKSNYLDARAIVIDRLISDYDYKKSTLLRLGALTDHDYLAPKYWQVIDKMSELWLTLLATNRSHYTLCGENQYFQRYCAIKN